MTDVNPAGRASAAKGAGAVSAEEAAAVKAVRELVARDLGKPVSQTKVRITTAPITWTSANIGLPTELPVMGGAAVMTPGFVVHAEAAGSWYRVHVSNFGPVGLYSKVPAEQAKALISEAAALVAATHKIDPSKVKATEISSHPFRRPGRTDAKELTLYQVHVTAEGKQFELDGELGKLMFKHRGFGWCGTVPPGAQAGS